jgi:UDP-N-acetylmuramyl pentapeptide phosphotransferase/UDP-N-acetylglucosamine-1-phosphate transferase
MAGTCAGLVLLASQLPKDHLAPLVALLGMALAMGVLGLIDDIFDLNARLKLGIHVALAIAFAAFVAKIGVLPLAAGLDLPLLPIFSILGTALWIVVLVNGLNFIDGANGLAPGAAIIILAAIGMLAGLQGQSALSAVAIIAAAASLGFLPWNLPGGRVFQGDAGALFSGFLIAGLAVLMADPKAGGRLSPYPVVFASLPLLTDVFLTLLSRARRKQGLLTAHRGHLFQRWLLADPKRTHAGLSIRFWILTAAFAGLGVIAETTQRGSQAGLLALSILICVLLWRRWDRSLQA